jgi:cyclopropane-fatty-acyl-phospholipid synthase
MLNETTQHYNMDVRFFQSFLDPYMKYTSGLFETASESLEVATQRMLDRIIDEAGITPGAQVLEIGPGWGALLKRMKERGMSVSYTGVSPSKAQNQYIQSWTCSNEQLVTTTFESFEAGTKKFDAIVLIGSFCHLSNKAMQLKRMQSMLSENGSIVIEDTFFTSKATYQTHAEQDATRFVQEKIFGFAEILCFSDQVEQICNAGLKITSLFEHSDSYKWTIGHWIRNLKRLDYQQYPSARDFVKYMTIAQRGWNNTTQNQLLVLKNLS